MSVSRNIRKTPVGVITKWGEPQKTVTLTTSGALDPTLPAVVVPANYFPPNMSLVFVAAAISFRKCQNSNAAANKLSGDQYIQVQKAAGALTNAIKFVDDELDTALSADSSGDTIVGSIDIKSTVDSDDATYNFQWTNALTDQDSLILWDVKMGLWFYLA